MKTPAQKSKRLKQKASVDRAWEAINPHAAGIDIGSREHFVCVPPEAAQDNVRSFGTFTPDLEALAEWLEQCGVKSVAMEATGVYWIPVFQILEARGFAVILANARQTKNVAGRKSDVQDCQWIQRLHTYGLLRGSFRPEDPYCVLRTYLRHRDELVGARSTQCQHVQKALQQMNVQLTQVLSDVMGVSGRAIIRAIMDGQRDPEHLLGLVDGRVRATPERIKKALRGDYRPELLFVLGEAFGLHAVYEERIRACEERIARECATLPARVDRPLGALPPRKPGRPAGKDRMHGQDMREVLYGTFGVDLTAIESIGVNTALVVLSEVGPNMNAFPSEKHFSSWLGLCPDNRISGGRVLSSHTRRVVNRLSDALRMAAVTLERSKSALGGYYRRMKGRLGAAEAVTATAHKLARIIYRLIKHGEAYVRQGLEDYEKNFRERKLHGLRKAAVSMGFELVENQQAAPSVS
jgi:transposase